MTPRLTSLLCLPFLSLLAEVSMEALELRSPNQRLEFKAILNSQNVLTGYQVRRDAQHLLSGGFQLETSPHGLLFENATIEGHQRMANDSTFFQPGGKQNPIVDRFNALTIRLKTTKQGSPQVTLDCRAYDDGIAFRYTIHKTDLTENTARVQTTSIANETTTFKPAKASLAWPLYLPSYTTSHEATYERTPFAGLQETSLIATPLLLEYDDGPALAITEAALSNYPGMYLRATRSTDGTSLRSDLSPLPAQSEKKATITLPFTTPWRVIMVGDSAGSLLESNLILKLNPSSTILDSSWIRFGKTTWNWWNGFYPEPIDFEIGANYATAKHYIDFCADNGIEFHAIDCADENFTWYQQSASGFAPSSDADILSPRPELEFFRTLEYAKKREVGIRLWVHWEPLSKRLEEAFAQYENWGIEGLMVDFLDRDDQEMIRWSEKVLQVAAKHHLRIQFHGAWKPTGLRRTYPNLVNHEGVLNLEYLKWSEDCTPEHNLTVPFTRMLAGPMDYHLGGFLNVRPESFEARNQNPMVLGTRCHHLAMYVAYENAVPMVCDAPSAYIDQPGFDFIRQVPTEWDETRFLAGEVSDFLVIARRSDQDWYIAAMTDSTERTLQIPLSFLPNKRYQITRWADISSAKPRELRKSQEALSSRDTLQVRLSSGGGQVLHLVPKNE